MIQKLKNLLKAYEQIIYLDVNDTSSIRTPSQAFGLLLNLFISLSALIVIEIIGSEFKIKDAIIVTFFIILGWTIITRILYSGSNWKEILTLHLNLSTFWIAVTLFFILFASWLFSPLARTPKTIFVSVFLLILVPAHIFQFKFPFKRRLLYFPLLLLNNGLLTWALLYR